MRDGVLLPAGHFGRGQLAIKGVGEEERVVAKAVAAALLVADLSLAAALRHDFGIVRVDEDERAHETCGALVIGHVG